MSVLRFGGADEPVEAGDAPALFQAFASWVGAVYAMEHDVALDPESLASFDAVDVMPLYHAEAERAREPMREGLTIEQSWLAEQLLLRRPSTCVLVDRFVGQPVGRITRLRVAEAGTLVGELVERLARNFRFQGRVAWVAAFEDAYFEAAPPIQVGVLFGDVAHTVSFVSADPRSRELDYHDPWPDGTLLPGRPSAEEGQWTIDGDALAAIAVYAFVDDVAPVERSPDIYARSVRREADPSKGAPLDVAWHTNWELAGPSYCLAVEGGDAAELERIPYRAELPADALIELLVDAWPRREKLACTATIRIDAERGHAVSFQRVDAQGAVFHDPWPEGSLVPGAQPAGDLWRITLDQLRGCLRAVFIDPEVLAELQGLEHRRTLTQVLAGLGFFGVREISRTRHEEEWEVEAQPGGFQDKLRLRFAVDEQDRLEAALLAVDREWLGGAGAPFAFDILKSFLATVVSPLDEGEASVAIGGLAAIPYGQQAVVQALGSGAPHLLGQARELALATAGAQESALVTLCFSRIVASSADGRLNLAAERAGRTAGPFFVGAKLPKPWA